MVLAGEEEAVGRGAPVEGIVAELGVAHVLEASLSATRALQVHRVDSPGVHVVVIVGVSVRIVEPTRRIEALVAPLGDVVGGIPADRAGAKLGEYKAVRVAACGGPIRRLKARIQQGVDGIRLNARGGARGRLQRAAHGARATGGDATLGIDLRTNRLTDVNRDPAGLLRLGLALSHGQRRDHRHQKENNYQNHQFRFHRFVLSLSSWSIYLKLSRGKSWGTLAERFGVRFSIPIPPLLPLK